LNIGIDIDNTITNIQEKVDKAAYDYARKLGKHIEEGKSALEEMSNNGDVYREKLGFTYEELKYFLIEPNLNMFHSNVASVKSKLKGGDILYVHDNVSLAELKVIISEINYKGFRLANIKELIKE